MKVPLSWLNECGSVDLSVAVRMGRSVSSGIEMARGARNIFQPLEKNFPTIGKNGAIFPTIGKKFSNHWKKPEKFFQSLENRRKIFPIVGKLLTPFPEKGAAA